MNHQSSLDRTHLSVSGDPAFIVKSTVPKTILKGNIFSLLLLAASSYWAWGRENPLLFVLVFFVPFPVLLGIYLRSVKSELSMSSEELIYTFGRKRYQMRWDEVAKVEIDQQDRRLVFYVSGGNKRMVVLLKTSPRSEDFPRLQERMVEELEKRQIPLEKTGRASYLGPKNTEMK